MTYQEGIDAYRNLTKRRLAAIREALTARLAGEIDVEEETGIDRQDYEAALDWVQIQITRRAK